MIPMTRRISRRVNPLTNFFLKVSERVKPPLRFSFAGQAFCLYAFKVMILNKPVLNIIAYILRTNTPFCSTQYLISHNFK